VRNLGQNGGHGQGGHGDKDNIAFAQLSSHLVDAQHCSVTDSEAHGIVTGFLAAGHPDHLTAATHLLKRGGQTAANQANANND
jgi:uncharacterized protein YgfB (UPF0149 family)